MDIRSMDAQLFDHLWDAKSDIGSGGKKSLLKICKNKLYACAISIKYYYYYLFDASAYCLKFC